MDVVSLPIAFVAGLISFLAPCLVPLLPAYLGYVSGVSASELKQDNYLRYRTKLILNSLIYVAGFSLIFVLLGLGATAFGKILITNRTLLLQIGGLFIIFFGISLLGIFDKFSFAQKEFRLSLPEDLRRTKYLGPFLMGNTFALAWTPCIGVILGSILTMAATSQILGYGALLLFVYSLGIGLPFLIVALTTGISIKLLAKIAPSLHKISVFGGILLIIVGILMVTQNYDFLSGVMLNFLYRFEFYQNLQNYL